MVISRLDREIRAPSTTGFPQGLTKLTLERMTVNHPTIDRIVKDDGRGAVPPPRPAWVPPLKRDIPPAACSQITADAKPAPKGRPTASGHRGEPSPPEPSRAPAHSASSFTGDKGHVITISIDVNSAVSGAFVRGSCGELD